MFASLPSQRLFELWYRQADPMCIQFVRAPLTRFKNGIRIGILLAPLFGPLHVLATNLNKDPHFLAERSQCDKFHSAPYGRSLAALGNTPTEIANKS
jgi:hypothetical protein